MPRSAGQANLSQGLNALIAAHAQDDTEYGMDFSDPPPGIKNGVAELRQAQYIVNKGGKHPGKPQLRFSGVILDPERVTFSRQVWKNGKAVPLDAETVKCAGMQTTIFKPLYSTEDGKGNGKSAEENVAAALNEVRKLGGENCLKNVRSDDELKAILAEIEKRRPKFKMSTSISAPSALYPESGVFQNWFGTKGLEDYVAPASDGGVVDESGGDEAASDAETDDTVDLDALAELADDDDDTESKDTLASIASEAGIADDDVLNAEDWKAVVGMIREAQIDQEYPDEDLMAIAKLADEGDEEAVAKVNAAGEEAGVEDEFQLYVEYAEAILAAGGGEEESGESGEVDESTTPAKGDIYFYKPPRAQKYREVEVTAVFEGSQKANVKSIDDGNLFKSVAWDQLHVEAPT